MTRESRLHSPKNRATPPAEDYQRLLCAALSQVCEDSLIGTDLQGIITFWKEGSRSVLGYEADEMIGTNILRTVPEELHSDEIELLRSLKPGATRRYESVRIGRDSNRFHFRVTVCPIEDPDGTVIGALRMERETSATLPVDQARAHLAAIVESSNDAIISKNLDGTVTSWNQAASRVFGYAPGDMIGQSILKIIPDDLQGEEAEILRKIRSGERIEHYETRRVRANGEIVEVSLTISPIRDDDGRVIGSSKIAREISERKRMERQLIQSEKLAATGRMAATVAHEINNPLDSVMNLVYLARMSVGAGSKAVPYLLTAEKELERVSHIARQTLGYYRDPGAPSDVSLEHLFEEILSIYRSKLLAANIAADCKYAHNRRINASKDELMQIFSNLVINSIDAMPDGGVLTIQTREIGHEGIEISVHDRGTGIPPENLDKVFEPFFSTKGQLGTGIGLWVARQLLEKRGGTISLQSNTKIPLNGTTVSVFIPFQT